MVAKKKKLIPIKTVTVLEADKGPVATCPEMEEQNFQFHFRGKCPMVRCQYCTTVTPNGCMALDRKESAERTISNKEIYHYKKGLFPELEDSDQKQLDALVRKSQTRARVAICLDMFIHSLDGSNVDKSFQYIPHRHTTVDHVHEYLIQTFPAYLPWMLVHLSDVDKFNEVVSQVTQSELNLGTALKLTPKKYQTFCQALRQMKDSSGETNE
ncbi:hypothetical protein fHeYen902_123 [Yersinia phage fHe-Yen9-02]|nr:hypothetical protein fHeYen902_123 [Yersinia phage fHe-Yen9-02]